MSRPEAARHRCRRGRRRWRCAALVAVLAGCAPGRLAPGAPPTFERATLWVIQSGDSARLRVEIADSPSEHEQGLAGRPSLAPDAGMLFRFAEPRSADDGFWMWGTLVPLDIAFIDADGVVVQVLGMEVCSAPPDSDDCRGYFPAVGYASALEVSRGWFAERGFTRGARVRVER